METFFHVVAESARSAAGAGQDGQNDAFKDVHMWLQDFSNAEKADSLSRPDMCTCVANFCHAAQTAEADLLAKVVQAGLQNASHFFAVIRELKEVAFPKLWDLLKSKLGKTFVQNQVAYRDAVSDSFLPTEAGWADLSSTAASAAGVWQSMKPLAKVLAKENELPEMQGQFLQSEILRCCCVFMQRKASSTVTMWNDDLYAAVKGLTDACKKWQSPPGGIVTGAHMKILKKYDTMSTSIRTYCILDPDLISWVGWFS